MPAFFMFALATFLLTRPSRDVTALRVPIWNNCIISTHTPLAGRDILAGEVREEMLIFLLTRPSRDVTHPLQHPINHRHISTHTPLAGRDVINTIKEQPKIDFYSHAPRGT